MKTKTILKTWLIAAAVAIGFTACEPEKEEPKVLYTVTFDTQGGIPEITSKTVAQGDTVTVPPTPSKQGYIFAGWQLDSKAYKFSTPITANITLIAKWNKATYTVTFDTDEGSDIATQIIDSASVAIKPTPNPTKQGLAFVEWQLNGSLYDFSTPVTSNITLTAKWGDSRIQWTHVDGSTRYTNAPADGILRGTLLTASKTDIKSVDYIPSSVTVIGEYAFSSCTFMTNITIPNSVTEIGGNAFSYCRDLTSVIIPSSVTTIKEKTFEFCYFLASVTIPNSITTIEYGAFWHCSSLKSITIPSSVTAIGWSAFANTALRSITIPSSITTIGSGLFENCSFLTVISIPSNVTTIESGAFAGCSSLTSISIPTNVTTIGESAFARCSSLTSISIPSTITAIKRGTFAECTSLTNFTIPNRVTEIGEYAFSGCSFMTNITIPGSITIIEKNAFSSCRSLTSITIPSGVMRIEPATFRYCTSLTSITIPSNVAAIGWAAFEGCTSLKSVRVERTTPPTGADYMFDDNPSLSITVPSGSAGSYKTATWWSYYASQIAEY